jgi:hypothetical protein
VEKVEYVGSSQNNGDQIAEQILEGFGNFE